MPDKYYVCNAYGRDKGHFQEVSLLDVIAYFPGTTKYDICKYLGLESFDFALPQHWLADVAKVTGIHAPSHFVWSYAPDSYDQPIAITREGATILRIYNYIKEKEHGRS